MFKKLLKKILENEVPEEAAIPVSEPETVKPGGSEVMELLNNIYGLTGEESEEDLSEESFSSVQEDSYGQTADDPKSIWHQSLLLEFYEPYKNLFRTQNAHEGYLSILEILDREGDCPSVVSQDRYKDYYPSQFFEILKKVTLRAHSVNVARQMLKLLKKEYLDYENLIPKALIVSFGHDLGKSPPLCLNNGYSKGNHPILSAQKVEEIFWLKGSPFWFPSALEMIKNHHRFTKDSLTLLLQKADSLARQEEALAGMPGFRSVKWDDWFDPFGFLLFLEPHINEVGFPGKWESFSFCSVVYFLPDYLYKMAREFALKNRVLDMSLFLASEKKEVLRKIVSSLDRVSHIPDGLWEGSVGRYYEIRTDTSRRRLFLIPVKIEAFGMANEIEKRKKGKLSFIRSVRPS